MSVGGGRPVTENITRLGKRSRPVVGGRDERRSRGVVLRLEAGVVPDHSLPVGRERLDVPRKVHPTHAQLDALPLEHAPLGAGQVHALVRALVVSGTRPACLETIPDRP